jgi:glycosyltransferase involved in cell wall biosynthesis
MACGCVPITSSVGGLKYLIDDGVNGYLIKSIDSSSICNAILMSIDNQSKANNMVNGYPRLLNYYTLDETRERYANILSMV